MKIEYTEKPRRKYTIDGVEVPSVTTVLGVLNKPSLPWWGQGIGVKGILQLHNQGVEIPWHDIDGAVKLLTEHKITVNHRLNTAADRGVGVHQALEDWCTSGAPPRPSSALPEDRGYMQALARALIDLKPDVIAAERMVGSIEHGYAGRYDLRAKIGGRDLIVDAKTAKGVYPESHFPQVEAYRHADDEMGNGMADGAAVLRLGRDGAYEFVESYGTFEDFLGVKAAYDSLQALKARKPKTPRKRSQEPLTAAVATNQTMLEVAA